MSIGGGYGRGRVCGHSCWFSGLSSAGVILVIRAVLKNEVKIFDFKSPFRERELFPLTETILL